MAAPTVTDYCKITDHEQDADPINNSIREKRCRKIRANEDNGAENGENEKRAPRVTPVTRRPRGKYLAKVSQLLLRIFSGYLNNVFVSAS